MLKKNKIIILFISIIWFPVTVFSNTLERLVGVEIANQLISQGSIDAVTDEGNAYPSLIPNNEFIENLINRHWEEMEPSLYAESLKLYSKPQSSTWTKDEKLALLNEYLALSSLAGMKYYSKTKGKMRVLYEESDVIDDPENKKIIKDPVYPHCPDSLIVFTRQKDTTFGENIYRYNYYCRPDVLVFTQENLSTMNYGILPLIGKNKLCSVISVIDMEEYLLIHILSIAKASPASWMKKRVQDSFSNRANALMDWFAEKADRVYNKQKKN